MATFPETKAMVDAATRYLLGEGDFLLLLWRIRDCVKTAKRFGAHPAIVALAEEWEKMIERCEFRSDPNSITEAEFRAWLQEQFDSGKVEPPRN